MSEDQYHHMTQEQLLQLQRDRYAAARQDGTFDKLKTIARELGWDPASRDENGNRTGMMSTYGPKYRWVHEDIVIYVDDYYPHLLVSRNGRRIVSTHLTELFIIPGDWLDKVLPFYDDAIVKRGERFGQREAAQRRDALSKIE